ncbi:MAG: TIGR00266 family protein [Planctomycetota bacterium]
MKIDLDGNPDFGEALIELESGETFRAASGAMNWMDGNLALKARLLGGLLTSLARRFLGGTSLFITEFSAAGPSRMALSHSLAGTLVRIPVTREGILIAGGAFTACTQGVRLKTRFGGFKAFFSGKGAFFIEAAGEGEVLFGAYGALVEKELDGELVIDNGHVLAWEQTLDWKLGTAGGLKSTFFSGEGLVMRFSGRGRIWLQTRHLDSTAGWVTPFLRA